MFKLPLRTLEEFINNSLFQLMDVPLPSPDYRFINKRAKQVNIPYRLPSKGLVAHLMIDATGLKAGELTGTNSLGKGFPDFD